ncbi:hypothetical protein [Saccharicrinis sp. FJH54]|uniref:hypothetical protein n=1 Tax=Saccharicrinis sp. FJH54 TaxID=3344665 RepID=UPI0035D4579B
MIRLNVISILLVFIALSSCTGNKSDQTAKKQEADSTQLAENIPVAFEENKYDLSSLANAGRIKGDQIDKLFDDYLEEHAELELAIEKYRKLQEQAAEKNDRITTFINNNDRYYRRAEGLLNSVKDNDTLIFKLLESRLNSSIKNFTKQKEAYENLSQQESELNDSWHAYLTALKILKTMEMVEKYQDTEPLDKEAYKELIKQMETSRKDLIKWIQ